MIKVVNKKAEANNDGEKHDAEALVFIEGLWYNMRDKDRRLAIPECLKLQMIQAAHDLPLGGHMGRARTYERLRSRYWWHGMRKDVQEHVAKCSICNSCMGVPASAPLAPEERIGRPFARVGIDFMKLIEAESGNTSVVVVIDHASKWVEAKAVRGESAMEAAQMIFDNIICRHGCPQEVWSDRGTAFTGKVFEDLAKRCGFVRLFTSGYHPETNGLTERANRTFQMMLKKVVDEQKNWDKYLQGVVWVYNTSKNSATGLSPYEILHGEKAVMPEDAALLPPPPKRALGEFMTEKMDNVQRLREEALQNQRAAAKSQKKHHDKHAKERCIEVGDVVRWRRDRVARGQTTKLNRRMTGPWLVVQKESDVSFRLKGRNGVVAATPAHIQDLIKVNEEF